MRELLSAIASMKVVLVNPPRSSYDLSELSPPLGLLRLGTAARSTGADVSIIDFNLLWHTDNRFKGSSFYNSALELLRERDADVYGFTSMAVDSHVSLELGKLIKQEKADAVTVFGGTHFSSIAPQLLRLFPWIDFIIQSEGEHTFRRLIEHLQKNGLAGVDLRSRNFSAAESDLGSEFNNLPFPDYELVDLKAYFALNPKKILDFEGGRGCRFKCAFCYSPIHYKKARSFSIEKRIAELHLLRDLGAEHISFVEDNFLNDAAEAIQFCRELEAARLGLTWNCYVTFPQLSAEVITWLARAGCTSIFAGIDAVGKTSQKAFHKGFWRNYATLRSKLHECTEAGILPTCAFLLSPPSHPCGADTEETLKAALAARTSEALVRLNTLTLYNGTMSQVASTASVTADDLKPRLLLDVPDVVERNDYAANYPELFPFHSRYVAKKEWASFLHLTHCLFTLYFCYPKTLEDLWVAKDISPLAVAKAVMEKVGDLTLLEKPYRRAKEIEVALPILERLTEAHKASRWLEAESLALGIA